MGTILRILALCLSLGHLGSVTSDSCGSDTLESQTILLVNLKSLAEFLETKKESQGNDSPKYLYSKDDVPCSKAGDDCSAQKCCEEKTPKCNVGTQKCDCFNSTSNKFTGRPLIYLQNSGKCGENAAGCTICLDLAAAQKTLGLDQDQGHRLEGNGSALALSTFGNHTSLVENDGRDVRTIGLVLSAIETVLGVLKGLVASLSVGNAGGVLATVTITIETAAGALSGA